MKEALEVRQPLIHGGINLVRQQIIESGWRAFYLRRQDGFFSDECVKKQLNVRRGGRLAAGLANVGWGGRIRTSVWRDQNPLPYRLATPQCPVKFIYICASRSRIGDTFSPRATKLRQRSGTRAAMRSASIARSQGAKIQEPVPVSRAFPN